jgi:hypothetical protein
VVNTFQQNLNADLANVFFNVSEFSVSCSYTHKITGVTQNYNVLFDDPTMEMGTGTAGYSSAD